MSRQTQGLKKEHDIAKEIYEHTAGKVIPLRSGWSGNQAVPSPDLLIPLNGKLRAVELKTSSQKRMTVEPEDVEDIAWWTENQKEIPTIAYLSVKFTYWRPYTAPLVNVGESVEESFERWARSAPFDTNITKTGNLTVGHPSEYDVEWESAQTSDEDGVEILRQLYRDSHSNLMSVSDVLSQGRAELLYESQ